MATVSVLMPTFNRAGYIGAAIESVLAQSHPPTEIIVLDDGSSDATAAVCARFGQGIQYVSLGKNRGKSAAINHGLSLATGEFIWVMDDDDIAPSEALATLLAPMLRSPGIGFTFGALDKFTEDEDGRRTFHPVAPPAPDARSLFVRLMEDCFITGQPCALIRRAAYDAIGPIDETVLASVDYNILLQVARRFEGFDVGRVVLWQRQHAGARGPAQLRYGSNQRASRWMSFDARLLGDLLPQLSLHEFVGAPSSRTLTAVERRRALFQKAVVAGRKTLWEMSVAAIREARQTAGNRALSAADRHVLSQMLGSRYGIDAFIGDRKLQGELAAAAGEGPLGLEIRTIIASRLTYWIGQALAQGDAQRLVRTAAAMFGLVGWQEAARLALAVAARKAGLVAGRSGAPRDQGALPTPTSTTRA